MYTAPAHQLARGLFYSVCAWSHSVSLANALPRCEILFFSTLGISAYVWPSYSKQASHPVVQISFFPLNKRTVDLPKSVGPRASTILPCRTSEYNFISGTWIVESNLGSSLEDDGFVARAFRICKCAYGLGALVFEPGKKLVELLNTERFHEPFSG